MYYNQPSYTSISPRNAKIFLGQHSDTILIDVRNPEEYADGHISGSINIPLSVLPMAICSLPINLYTPIIVYCRTGIRASNAACMLVNMGFMNVYNLGGIKSWPYKVVK